MIHFDSLATIDFNRNPFDVSISIPHEKMICGGIPTPTLLDLAAMKAFAMMYRKKWKDAVDLYFIMEDQKISLAEIITRSKEIFGKLYQEIATIETILENNWDFTETVEYIVENPPEDSKISQRLIECSSALLQ